MTTPTKAQIHTTSFDSTDRLNLQPFCKRLEDYLIVEHDYVDGGLVVGLNAGFGAGKTTFIRMWEADLQTRRDRREFVPMPVVLNAWESDYCGDPLLAILAGLIQAVDTWNGEAKPADKKALKEAAKDVAWFALGLANGVVAKHTGLDSIKAADLATEKRKAREPEKPDFIELYQQRTNALTDLKQRLATVFSGEAPKVFVFVDELDRCRPDYAVSYLEAIKHVFDVRGMVFVLAIDYEHLAISTRALFGQDLVFDEYFRKFCHRLINLPEPVDAGFANLADDYVNKYLHGQGQRICSIDTDPQQRRQFVELATGLRMGPRQLQEAFRIVGQVSAVLNPDHRGKLLWCIAAAIILFAFLRVSRREIYIKLMNGHMPHEEVGRLLISIVGKKDADWWFKIYLTGLPNNTEAPFKPRIILEQAGFLDARPAADKDTELGRELGQFNEGWGRYSSGRLPNIFRRIETVDSIAEQ